MKTIDLTTNKAPINDGKITVIFSATGDTVSYRGEGEYLLITDEEADDVAVKVEDLARLIEALQIVEEHIEETGS